MIVSQKALHKEQSTHMVLLLCWYYSLSNHMVTQDKDTNYKNWFLLNAPSNQTLPRPLTTLFQQITEKKVNQLRLSSLLRRHSALESTVSRTIHRSKKYKLTRSKCCLIPTSGDILECTMKSITVYLILSQFKMGTGYSCKKKSLFETAKFKYSH